MWRAAIEVPVGAELEYKLVHVPATAAPPRWEDGENHTIKVDLEASCRFNLVHTTYRLKHSPFPLLCLALHITAPCLAKQRANQTSCF